MNLKTLSNQRLTLLEAAASPGSALTNRLGKVTFGVDLLRRTKEEQAEHAIVRPGSGNRSTLTAPPVRPPQGWLARLFDRLEDWSWERQLQVRERYLAESHDLYDLEYRMRQLDGDTLSRGASLR